MPDILHDFIIRAPAAKVFWAVSAPEGLDRWWTRRSAGTPVRQCEYQLEFGSEYDWRGRVTEAAESAAFELEITAADRDWTGTRVGFQLRQEETLTRVCFHHSGWAEGNEHFRVSSFCWAMYLRLLRRFLEQGESVPYDQRLEV